MTDNAESKRDSIRTRNARNGSGSHIQNNARHSLGKTSLIARNGPKTFDPVVRYSSLHLVRQQADRALGVQQP
jgi:hypothetical protein